MNKWYKAYDIFINSTKLGRLYSKRKAIELAQKDVEIFNKVRAALSPKI